MHFWTNGDGSHLVALVQLDSCHGSRGNLIFVSINSHITLEPYINIHKYDI